MRTEKLLGEALARAAVQLLRRSAEYKRRALRYLKHSWKVYSLSRALARARERFPGGLQLAR